jgi:hypothetical protein
MVNRTGKYVSVKPYSRQAFGICDRTGYLFDRKDLVKQRVWAGDKLVWTGLWVGKPFLDIPNQQSRPPLLGPDPVPIPFPRPPLVTQIPWEQIRDEAWEFQGFPWEEEKTSPTSQIDETLTGWGAPTDAEEALPGKDRQALLQQATFGRLEGGS